MRQPDFFKWKKGPNILSLERRAFRPASKVDYIRRVVYSYWMHKRNHESNTLIAYQTLPVRLVKEKMFD